jgi:hypothetical protein
MFCAKANFLVAQALMNYTETLGSFMHPYRETRSGTWKRNKKGELMESYSRERFLSFFSYLGGEYEVLVQKYWGRNRKKVYDDLRNGLTHEYLIKRKYFTVYGTDNFRSDSELDNLKIDIDGRATICKCGIIHQTTKNREGYWHFINGKYFVDFKRAIERFIEEIEAETSPRLNKNFFTRVRQINLKHFA